jgi:peptide-methionine (S)-S-oxide reductase
VEGFIEALEDEGVYEGIVTEVEPLGDWYRAEEKHQNYFEKNPNQPYCAAQVRPKVEKVREKFAGKVRADGGVPERRSLADRVRRLFR